MASGDMTYITKFHKVRFRRPNVDMEAACTELRAQAHTHTHTQQGDIISLLVFFQNKYSELKKS
jgi:hypothetical protein